MTQPTTYLVDGFPRNMENLNQWLTDAKGIAEVPSALYVECSLEVMTERIQRRAEEAVARGEAVRNDDNLEVLSRRFNTFKEETGPVLDYFEQRGKLIRLDGSRAAEEVTRNAIDYFQ